MSDTGQEYRIFGPPGTGKTTFLARQVEHAAEKFGPEKVLVTSFTRAAAAELVGRSLPIPKNNIGTLHAHCYRALGNPVIAETKIKEWNEENPDWSLSGGKSLDEPSDDQKQEGKGDEIASRFQNLRALMLPPEVWPLDVQQFALSWDAWKKDNGLLDFTDLLEVTLRDIHTAPGEPAVLIADEAQDFSKLQLSLVRRWGSNTEYMLVAGDEDQLLYGWCGCTPDAFLTPPVPEDRKRVLSQSYRVPRAVHRVAEKWIKQVAVREPKEYQPRDDDGQVRQMVDGCWKYPGPILDDAAEYLAQGKRVMFLAACSYMLDPIRRALRKAGEPFHNPYRRVRGDWNPLAARGTTTASRILAFLRPREDVWGQHAGEWCAEDLRRWVEITKAEGLLARGAKKRIGAMSPTTAVGVETIDELFLPGAADEMIGVLANGTVSECMEWLGSRVIAAKKEAVEYPAAVINAHGPSALFDEPKIILGTIHSVKGGEADVVYLIPDLSYAGAVAWTHAGESHDGIVRQWYVGMTRARESLVLCAPAPKADCIHVGIS